MPANFLRSPDLQQRWSGPGGSPPREGTRQLMEVLVFLFLIMPSMVLSFFVVRAGSLNFPFVAVSTILRDLSLLCLVLYFIWRNGESLRDLGWNLKDSGREAALGALLFVPVFFGAGLLEDLLRQAGVSPSAVPTPSFFRVHGSGEIVLAVILVLVVALAEETIFRGYLLLRFQEVSPRPILAAVLSAVIFSLGHGYEGTTGVITVGALGLAFALIYLWRGSLVAPMVMHFLQDFIGIILPALTALK
jgi:membrane protease YdiL (CAAX protease family)